MPEFAWRAIAPDGSEQSGALREADEVAAREALEARRMYVVRIEAREGRGREPAGQALLGWRRGGLSTRELMLFSRQLATLAAVSPLEEALRTLIRQSERPRARAIIGAVHGAVLEGRPLSDAMALEGRSFPPLYRAMVAAGEGSGTLPAILTRLALLQERQAAVRAKLLAALAYPAVLCVFAVLIVAALMIFVVPRIVEQFDTVGQTLPLLTRLVIALSGFLAASWWVLALLGLIGALAAKVALQRKAVRLRADGALLKTPLFGRLIRDLHAARIARTLATILASRLPLMDGLALTVPTVRNHVLRAAMREAAEVIRGGGSLSAALRRSGLFPPLLVYLAASGESAGRLDEMLESAANHLETEFDSTTAAALSLLEPMIVILMGALVALIILAILLPLLQLQSLTGL